MDFEGTASRTAFTDGRASVVVVNTGAGFAVEVGIDSPFTVFAIDVGSEELLFGNHHLENDILAVLGVAGEEVVVVHAVAHRGSEQAVGEGDGGVGGFNHIVRDRIVSGGGNREDVSATAGGHSNEFAIDGADRSDTVVDAEVVRSRRVDGAGKFSIDVEVLVGGFQSHDLGCRAVGNHLGIPRTHPSVVRAEAHVEHGRLGSERSGAATTNDVELDVGTVGGGVLVTCVRTQVVRIRVGTVAVEGDDLVSSGSVVEVTRAIARGVLVHTNQQVTCAVILERGVERDGRPTGFERHCTAKHHVRCSDRLIVSGARENISRDKLHKHIHLIGLGGSALHVEADGIDRASSSNLVGSVNLLNERVAP